MKFAEMTSAQLAKVDRQETIVVIPIAAIEQHGPHLPTGTDTILCSSVAQAVEAQREPSVLLTPTYWLGASAHHLRFGATLDAGLDTYIDSLCQIATSLLDDGYLRLLFLNGHGGNVDPMKVATRMLQEAYPEALLAAGSYWCVADQLMNQTLTGDHKFVGHACEFETSLMLHLRPELVDSEQLANAGELVTDNIDGAFLSRDMRHRTHSGFTGRPDLATAQKGQLLFDGIVQRITAMIDKLGSEPLGLEYKDFVG